MWDVLSSYSRLGLLVHRTERGHDMSTIPNRKDMNILIYLAGRYRHIFFLVELVSFIIEDTCIVFSLEK